MRQYVVDAFAEQVFEGNPAAVCVLEHWLPDSVMQKIAVENHLSETAFTVKNDDRYALRWFTPGGEIDLCGHATLGTAFVLANFYEPNADCFVFETMSGRLEVRRDGDFFEMDFPSRMPKPTALTPEMLAAFSTAPKDAYLSRDLMLVFDDEAFVRAYQPDWSKLYAIRDGIGVLITAPSQEYDFVSRCFFPEIDVPEDPVTGSAHCNFIPYWAERLGKQKMIARQVSARGGTLYCENCGDRVKIKGKAVLYSEATVHLPQEQ